MKVNNSRPVRLAALLSLLPGILIALEWAAWIHLPKWALSTCYVLIALSLFCSYYFQRRDQQRTGEV